MDLPNFAIPEVQVDIIDRFEVTTGTKTTTSLYTVQFTDSSNAGKQNTLECQIVADNDVNGAQPKFKSVQKCDVFNVGGPEWFEESGEQNSLVLTNFAELATATPSRQTRTKARVLPSDGSNDKTTYEDFQPCSSKGDCDGATGTCTCNSGHYGEACE